MNIIQEYQYKRFTRRDLWYEARKKNRPGLFVRLLLWLQARLFGRPAFGMISALGREKNAFIVDLSSYQPAANVEAMIDQGVTHFFLRMLYIGVYEYGNWQLTEDPTYRKYYTRIRGYAKAKGIQVTIGGYILYTAGVEDQDYARDMTYTDRAGEIMGQAYRPDVLIIDDEIDSWWQNGRKVTATPVNQVRGLVELRRKLYARYRILVMHYSARWFLNKYKDAYTTALDNINMPESLGGPGKQFPFWGAWYPQAWSEIFSIMRQVLDKLLVPTGTQEINYLNAPGSYTGWDAWQFTGSLVTPYNLNALGQPAGVDASVSRLSVDEFNAVIGVTTTTPPPPPPPPPPPVDTGTLEQRVTDLEAWAVQFPAYKKAEG